MNEQLKESYNLAILLAVYAMFIGIIIVGGVIGRSLLTSHTDKQAFKQVMTDYRPLAIYDDTVVTRDDIEAVVKQFTKKYDIIIQPYVSVYESEDRMVCDTWDYCLRTTDLLEKWEETTVRNGIIKKVEITLDEVIEEGPPTYRARIMFDEYSRMVESIVFTLEQE